MVGLAAGQMAAGQFRSINHAPLAGLTRRRRAPTKADRPSGLVLPGLAGSEARDGREFGGPPDAAPATVTDGVRPRKNWAGRGRDGWTAAVVRWPGSERVPGWQRSGKRSIGAADRKRMINVGVMHKLYVYS